MSRPGQRLLAVYLVGVLGMALLATGSGFVGVAAAANVPTCGDVTYTGSGTDGDPYEVGNVSQLQCIGGNHGDADSRSDALGANYTLVSDVDASETSSWNGGKGLNPVGNASTPFSGSFDGQGHTITGLTVNRSGTRHVGLFGYAKSATLSNVTLPGVDVTGKQYVGSVAGSVNGGSVRNVSASGLVSGTLSEVGGLVGKFDGSAITNSSTSVTTTAGEQYGDSKVGGIVGYVGKGDVSNVRASGAVTGTEDKVGGLVGSYDEGTLSKATATGDVDGVDRVGGLVGAGYVSMTVRTSSATGDVNGSKTVGGLLGENAGTVEDSFSTGNVSGTDTVGGLVGLNPGGSVADSFSTGAVSGTNYIGGLVGFFDGGTITDTYWRNTTSNLDTSFGSGSGDATGLTTAEMTGMNTTRNMGNLSFYDAWVPTKGGYPEPASLAGTDGTTADAFDSYFSGTGTESDPYVIETAPELQAMDDLPDANYTLGNDIDASETESWNDGTGFDPVGKSGGGFGGPDPVHFTGTFDGQGYTITGLAVDRTGDYNGLFRRIGSDGRVSNIILESVDVTGESYVGSLAGLSSGTIRNVSATGDVTGNHTSGDYTGGLVGFNDGTVTDIATTTNVTGHDVVGGLIGSDLGSSTNASASGTVSGNAVVGGLIGYTEATVSNATATASVSGNVKVGGFVGRTYSASVTHASARGDVIGNQSVGGFVGENTESSTVRDVFATGSVAGDTDVGGFAGNVTSGTVTDAYWNTDTAGASGNGNVSGGTFDATGLTTAEMTGTNATRTMTGLDFASTWEPTDGYPELGDSYLSTLPGDGTADSPYQLSTATELQAMQYDLGANYTLSADVDASETAAWDDSKGFAPIGDSSTPFTGSFDGQGHTISNLTINRSATDYVGLFGYVNTATLSNVTLAGVDVTGHWGVGSVVGEVNRGSVRNVSASGSVNGTARVGGLVAYFDGSVITNSSASVATNAKGTLQGGISQVGGLVGYLYEGNVSNVRASGSVSGAGNRVGGLVGEYNSGTLSNATASGTVDGVDSVGGLVGHGLMTIRNSLATGNIDGSSEVGGLVGHNDGGTIADSFSTGNVSGTGTVGGFVGWNDGGTVTDAYWRNTTSNPDAAFGSGSGDATSLTTAEMTGMDATTQMDGLSFYDVWEPTAGYPALASLSGLTGSDPVDPFDEGSGTAEDPYVLTSATELQAMESDPSAHYVLGSDVDASETSSWNGGKGFDPVGSTSTKFTGTFAGADHTITGLYVNRSDTNKVGLFGTSTDESAISNVTLRSATVTGNNVVGLLIGRNKGTVSNVSVAGTVGGTIEVGGLAGYSQGTVRSATSSTAVNGSSDVGGLIGHNTHGGESGGVVTASKASGTVNGSSNVGGLVGKHGGDALNTSVATGDVNGTDAVGGLVGFNVGPLNRSYALGDVTGTDIVGGLVGENWETISEAYATGAVTATNASAEDVGALVGNTTYGSETDVYWNTETADTVVAFGSGSGSATGLTTAEMTGVSAVSNVSGFDFADVWVVTNEYPTHRDRHTHDMAGDGTASNPFVITTVSELQAMSGALDAYYEHGNDIDASGTENWNDGEGFEPVGTGSSSFEGSFDGQGHTVSNLTIDRSNANAVGLFGYARSATFSNVTLSAVDVSGNRRVGSVVGNIDGGSVRNVSASGSVNGWYRVGGLIGHFDGSAMTNSTASVATTAGFREGGGLVGYVQDSDVSNVRASGSVSTTGAGVGGLVGGYNNGALSNATATGDVDGDSSVGGLVGHNNGGTIADSFSTGNISGTDTVGGFVGDNRGTTSTITDAYWRNTTSNPDAAFGSGDGDATALTTAEMTGENATVYMSGLNFASTWEPTNGYPELGDGYLSTLPGSGTADNPYQLSSASDLQAMRYDLDANYTLSGDVDASETATWNDQKGFSPVGDSDPSFTGSFDGQNHTITGLTITRSSTDRVGLFGLVGDSGTVANVSLSSVDIDGRTSVGGLAGEVFEGTVRNVSVSGTVNGTKSIGGLAGYLYDGSTTESSSAVTVSGDTNTGGLVGFVHSGTTSAVHASGAVHGRTTNSRQPGKNVGGLVGRYMGGTIHNASASGDVGGPSAVGGLIGKTDDQTNASNVSAVGDVDAVSSGGGLVGDNHGTVRDAFAAGAVTGPETGGLVGDNIAQGIVTNAYWDTTVTGTATATGQNDGSVDATGLTTAEMTGATAPENMANLTFADPWVTTDGYPVHGEHVTSLSLDFGTTSLTEGDMTDATVALSLLGGHTRTASTVAEYTSDDTSIFIADAGTVEAVGVGSASLTVTHAGVQEIATVSVDGSDPDPDLAPNPVPEPDPGPDPDPDEPSDPHSETSDPTEPTVWDNETTIRQHVTVPETATITRAEQVSLPVSENTSESVRATFTQNASVSSIQFPAGTNRTVTVVEFDRNRTVYDDTPGRSVRQFQITGSPEVKNATATVRTRIAESELQTAGIEQSDVRIAHRTNGPWQLLNTTVVEETNGTLVLEAPTEGLSPFAVTAVGTPEAALSIEPTAASTGDELTLDAGNSTTPYGEIVSYEWSVGGETHTGETATLTPEAAGEYTVELTVTNDAGRTATASTTVVVENSTATSTPPTNDTATQPETTSGSSGPGFGLIVALVALAGIALLAIRKSQ